MDYEVVKDQDAYQEPIKVRKSSIIIVQMFYSGKDNYPGIKFIKCGRLKRAILATLP